MFWVFVAATMCVIALWLISIWWHVEWPGFSRFGSAGLWSGRVWFFMNADRPQRVFAITDGTGPKWLRYTAPKIYWWFEHGGDANRTWVFIPLWTIALMLAIFAAGAGKLARQLRVNQSMRCSCGYSRTGLSAERPCPECGKLA